MDTLLSHPLYGPPAFSFYVAIAGLRPPPSTITVLHREHARPVGGKNPFFPCRVFHEVVVTGW